MSVETRDALRSKVMDTLMSTFPGAQKVVGGVAFLSDVVDEATGMLFPVELKVTVKNTQDTARSKAYDLDAEVAKAAERPGRRVADPAKKAQKDEVASAGDADSGIDAETKAWIEGLIAERAEAKKAKNYSRADEIRAELSSKGVTLKDTKEGTTYTIG